MNQSFADLFQKSLEETKMRSGDILHGEVVSIDNKFVLIDVGLKSEGVVPVEQFTNPDGTLAVSIGDRVEVAVESPTDDYGETRLSRDKAKRAAAWSRLVEAHKKNETILGYVSGKVKGGFTVEIDGVKAFLPGSLIDIRPLHDTSSFEGSECEFKIIKVDEKRNNIVVSRRAVIEAESSAERFKVLENLEEGHTVKGVVKNLTDYGAFIDLGGVDGLLHITDISWKRVKHPSEVLKVGEEVEAVVLKFDRDRSRVSLGIKQLHKDPWFDLKARYPAGKRLTGKVTNLTDYGCFVEIEDGVEGLVHMSEMDWTNKNVHPSKLVSVGDEVEVIVLEIDEERRRISLGMKQCSENPWDAFSQRHHKGERVHGAIKSITDFGVFIGLDGGIDGLVHLSDISWDVPGDQAIRDYKKGDELDAVILAIDPERERVSLGIKQLQDDPFTNYATANPKGSIVKGRVKEIEDKQAIITLADEVEGRIKAAEIAPEKVTDINNYLKVGDEIEAKVISINHKDRMISLSIKARNIEETKAQAGEPGMKTTLGDILKKQMEQDDMPKESD